MPRQNMGLAKRQISTFINKKKSDELERYCESHNCTPYKFAQEAIEKEIDSIGKSPENQNRQSNRPPNGDQGQINSQTPRSPASTTDNGELEE